MWPFEGPARHAGTPCWWSARMSTLSLASTPAWARCTGVTSGPCFFGSLERGTWRTPSGKSSLASCPSQPPVQFRLEILQFSRCPSPVLGLSTLLPGFPAQRSLEGWQIPGSEYHRSETLRMVYLGDRQLSERKQRWHTHVLPARRKLIPEG